MFARFFVLACLIGALVGAPQPSTAQEQITVFAAASLKNALDNANTTFTKATGIKIVASYEASSALARQIEQGAPADVFVSADLRWMDYAAEHKLIKLETHMNLLSNSWCLSPQQIPSLIMLRLAKVLTLPALRATAESQLPT